ncbi:MAG TPA: excinuclease ABC subunit UvrC [Chloroflexota bacterium]|nr:excinuclease ABC subunit UvrC [Chloroflexota bacterium]HZU08057.1 excinuclease ABC subunit UvrC [Chloroflexota bacterium]
MAMQVQGLLAERLRTLPDRPGVYLFKDAAGNIIYIGKATSLQHRVRWYFQNVESHPLKLQLLAAEAADVDYILTESPVQALRWEADLIKRERPRYNTRLRDDKAYPYIRISVQEPWPHVSIARRVADDGARYFGPFTDADAVRMTLDTLNRLFPYIRCRKPITGTDRRACIYYDIKRCVAPCIGAVTNAEYRQLIQDAANFLEGRHEAALERLRQEMEAAAEALQFERAAALRDRLRAVERIIAQQRVVTKSRVDQDILGLAREDGNVCVQVFYIRDGKLRGRDYFFLEGANDESDSAVVTSFLLQHYAAAAQIPPRILLPAPADDAATVAAWLREQAGQPVVLRAPQRGEGRRLVELASENAREALARQKVEWLSDSARTTGALLELQEYLGLDCTPERIECYDISNIQGTAAVGSMVVFERGRPKRSDYRRFQIKTVEGANDFAMLAEVLTRRFKRLREAQAGTQAGAQVPEAWAKMPDLVIVDGGKGQLSAALAVLDELELVAIPVVALAKEREELFLPGRSEPVVLPRGSPSLFLVQRIRDEAHRFAITYHRKVRGQRSLRSALDELPGIGPKRKRALLRVFGSVKGIKAASIDELAAVPGMTRRLAQLVKAQL